MIAPEWVAVSSFGRRRSLSDLAVWGFPETFPENLPPQALPHPFFSPLPSPFNSSTPQTTIYNSLEQAFINPLYPFNPLFPPPTSLSPIGPSPNTFGIPP